MTKVYCIIITYNAERWIQNCLGSIDEPNLDLNILVIDNGSQDNTLDIIQKKFISLVTLIEAKSNLGFAKANNLGYQIAKKNNAEYIYLLNQDTISYKDNIFKLIQLERSIPEKVGIISPIHLDDDGNKLDKLFESCINSKSCPNYISDQTLNKVKDYYPISFVNAAAWLIKVSTIEYLGGLFSSAFYHYGEDLNFGSRLKFFGYTIVICPEVYIHHCRAERDGKHSKNFINQKVKINNLTITHDISQSYVANLKQMIKYSLEQLSKGQFNNSMKILFYPFINYYKIKNYRKSYFDRNLKIIDENS